MLESTLIYTNHYWPQKTPEGTKTLMKSGYESIINYEKSRVNAKTFCPDNLSQKGAKNAKYLAVLKAVFNRIILRDIY
jgi:hypothetical protein